MTIQKLNCDKTKKENCDNSTQIVTTQKLKLWQNLNSNCDKTKKSELWKTKKKNSNIDKIKKNRLKKPKLWQNSRTQTATKLQETNCDKTWKIKL